MMSGGRCDKAANLTMLDLRPGVIARSGATKQSPPLPAIASWGLFRFRSQWHRCNITELRAARKRNERQWGEV